MNFSRHQERAERIGRGLLWLYAIAVAAVVVAGNGAAALAWRLAWGGWFGYPDYFFLTNTLVLAGLILGGSWIETSRLRQGGHVIADQLGATRADPGADLLERRLVNIVEEMAIAARTAVPGVYLLRDEPSINALAAGVDRNDCVVIVTAGALQRLDRAELQGVIAHELSHIVNGDVQLNTRLVGLNYGLELIGLLGRRLLGQPFRRSGAGRAAPLPPLVAIAAGAALIAIGALGTFAARVIKAAIGRQREFYADAQAVEFTRQRDGLGRALRKVAGLSGNDWRGASLRQSLPDRP
ncbi:MAG TPA: M48 family metalloprotease, partial [Burkholderiaceae bacterium]|nr:M48 family metalloprotease [Burkholderiaceae bacterium]